MRPGRVAKAATGRFAPPRCEGIYKLLGAWPRRTAVQRAVRATLALVAGLVITGCSGPRRAPGVAAQPAASAPTRPAPVISRVEHLSSDAKLVIFGDAQAQMEPPRNIELDELRARLQNGTAIAIDVREPEEFRRGHLRGALNFCAGSADEMAEALRRVEPQIADGRLLIVYCSGPACGSSEMVAEYLEYQGLHQVCIFHPGWSALALEKYLQ